MPASDWPPLQHRGRQALAAHAAPAGPRPVGLGGDLECGRAESYHHHLSRACARFFPSHRAHRP
eukprot:5158531-Prymnesium_polylepis.1